VRPTYPDQMFADLVAITGIDERSSVLEVGCGTGQATRSLAALGCSMTAVELGPGMAGLARQRLAGAPNVVIETSRSRTGTTAAAASTCWSSSRGG
jgi:16S rRNA A1518/A1519 N6-dimethyltransferase RsmA/KsgA/DIM1 with predicted DNA glycosylase/AP lyase activity